MKLFLTTLAILGASGCAACHQPSGPAPAGMPMAGTTAAASGTTSTEAIPAVGIGWHTVCFSIPKPKLFAVPRPQTGPQVVGIPILTGAPQMMMAQPQMMAAQPQPAQTMMHYVPAQPQTSQPQSQPEPQSLPSGCADSCTTEGCQTSQTQMMNECDALIRDIAQLQQELCIETSKASVRTRQ